MNRCGLIVIVFEFTLLPAPPAGFEPAHTAPERVAVQGSDLGKHASAWLARSPLGHG